MSPFKDSIEKPLGTENGKKKENFFLKPILVFGGFLTIVLAVLGVINSNFQVNIPNSNKEKASKVDGMDLVYVPAGYFMMGSDGGTEDENPIHKVYLDAFWIDKTEVTNFMYRKCIIDESCEEPSSTIFINDKEYDNHPVVSVTWQDAADYCAWAGRQLPTEAQWEKAARGTDNRIYPWGNTWDSSLANWAKSKDEYRSTSPVGSFPNGASPYGALDMIGNVWEWVADWYEHYYYRVSSSENPLGPDNGFERSHRGGSWYDYEPNLRASNRDRNPPHFPDLGIGFRCLLVE